MKKQRIILILNLMTASVLSGLSILFTVHSMHLFAVLVSAIYIIFALTQGHNKTFCFVVFALSNTHVLNIAGVSASVLICAFSAISDMAGRKGIDRKMFKISVLLLIYSIQYLIRYNDISSAVISPLKIIAVCLYFYSLAADRKIIMIMRKNISQYILFGVVSILVNIAVTGASVSHARASVLNNDPNMLSVEAAVYIAMSLVLFFRYEIISVMQFCFIFIFMSIVIVLCGSRNGFLLLFMSLMFTFAFNLHRASKILFLAAVISGVIFIVSSSSAGQNALTLLINRTNVMQARGRGISNGRIDTWKEYINAFNANIANWFLGFGLYTNAGLSEMGHNGFIEDIASYGLIGGILVYMLYFRVLKVYRNNIAQNIFNNDFYAWLPIIIIVSGSLTLRSLTNIINLSLLFISVIILAKDHESRLYTQ